MPPDSWDIELNKLPIKIDGIMASNGGGLGDQSLQREPLYEEPERPNIWRRMFDSFKRDPNSNFRIVLEESRANPYGWPHDPHNGGFHYHRAPVLGVSPYSDDDRESAGDRRGSLPDGGGGSGGGGGGPGRAKNRNAEQENIGAGGHYYDLHMAAVQTARSALARKLKGRHLQMIAMGGTIGTGLFVASGKALAVGGPASLLIAFSLIGLMLFCTVQALGELAVVFPVAGSFSAYSTRFLDPSWGFAMGWNYAMQWLVVLPLEIVAASITIGYWDEKLTRAVFVTIFLAAIIGINLFGVRVYGEAEFIFAIVKIIAVIGFILLGIVLNIGGTPTEGYIGGKYWIEPGAFNNGFKGLCSVFVTAAFAYAGTELVGLAAAETANPRKSLPKAIKQVFWRITLFYVVALTLVGLLVPYTEEKLIGATSKADAKASPFVIAIENAGIDVLPSVMNAVILIAVLSVGNSSIFGSSRTLAALADQSQAPKILAYVDRKGRPLIAIIAASSIGFLSYVADLDAQQAVLDWLLAMSGLSSIFTWGSICLSHIRFRQAWAHRHRSLDDLAFKSQPGLAGSYIGLSFNCLVLAAQFWTGLWPVGYAEMDSKEIAENFFLAYLAAPIILIFYFGHKLYYRTKAVRIQDMDIDTGRREFNLPVLLAQEYEQRKNWPTWKKVYKFMC